MASRSISSMVEWNSTDIRAPIDKSHCSSPGERLGQLLLEGGFRLERIQTNEGLVWALFCKNNSSKPRYTFSTLREIRQWWHTWLRNLAMEAEFLSQFEAVCDSASDTLTENIRRWLFEVPITSMPMEVVVHFERYQSAKRPSKRQWQKNASRISLERMNEQPANLTMRMISLFCASERRRLEKLPMAPDHGTEKKRL